MTTITIMKSLSGEYRRFTCKGHAEFAKFGKDIICSSISILVINTINSIDDLTKTKIKVDSNEKQGFIDCQIIGETDSGCKLLIDSMVLGLENVVEEYGSKYLELKFKEV